MKSKCICVVCLLIFLFTVTLTFIIGQNFALKEQNGCLSASIVYLDDSASFDEYESKLLAIKKVCKVSTPLIEKDTSPLSTQDTTI